MSTNAGRVDTLICGVLPFPARSWVRLTAAAERVLAELTRVHLAELRSLAPILDRLSAELKTLEDLPDR